MALWRSWAAWPSGFIDSTSHSSTPSGAPSLAQLVDDRHPGVLVAVDHADHEHAPARRASRAARPRSVRRAPIVRSRPRSADEVELPERDELGARIRRHPRHGWMVVVEVLVDVEVLVGWSSSVRGRRRSCWSSSSWSCVVDVDVVLVVRAGRRCCDDRGDRRRSRRPSRLVAAVARRVAAARRRRPSTERR